MINELEFFNQITMRICSSLDISEVARECKEYLKRYIPLDGITASYYDEQKKSVIFLAIESDLPLNTQVKVVPIPPQGQQAFEENKETVIIHNNPEEFAVPFAIWKALNFLDKSSITLFTWFKGKRLGQVGFFVRGRNRYTKEHAHLIELLHNPFSVAMAHSLQYQEIVNIKELFSHDIRQLRNELKQVSDTEILGENGSLRNVMEAVSHVAPLTTPVLLLGETGVGKEIIANRIHYSSPRKDGPFVKINCGAIPEGLIDSELFGHEKGAFTGAFSRRFGHFERAHQGTIFLDEVGDLPASAQVRLLRVLQEKEFERVGGSSPINVDVRIIAATNRNMEAQLRAGSFRKDLWFRLNVFPIAIPPLRERKQDLPALVHYFIRSKSRERNLRVIPELAPGSMEKLISYDWPGNVRELQNIVERSLIRMRFTDLSRPLDFEEFHPHSELQAGRPATDPGRTVLTLDEATRRHIQEVLGIAGGRVKGKGGAAELLGVNPSTLRHRMRALGIPYGRGSRRC